MPDDLQRLIGRRKATLQARVHYDGVTYSRATTHLGNSLIRFRPEDSFAVVPACIKYIYHEEGTIILAVQRQLPLADNSQDPFRWYPLYPAKLYSSRVAEELERVELENVMGHYARWEMEPGIAVVLALDRVSAEIIIAGGTRAYTKYRTKVKGEGRRPGEGNEAHDEGDEAHEEGDEGEK